MKRTIRLFVLLFTILCWCVGCRETEAKENTILKGVKSFLGQDVLKDKRDGQTYRIVKIGNQVWMAENLRFKIKESWCLDNKEVNCKKYGRFYRNGEASVLCPVGWHLPSYDEYGTLFGGVGDYRTLLSKKGWDVYGGNDYYNFTILPAGYKTNEGFAGEGQMTYLLTSSLDKNNHIAVIKITRDKWNWLSAGENGASSVRCVKDSGSDDEASSQGDVSSMIDSRDGTRYKIVNIGEQVWMAENLRYKTEESFCYDDVNSNCANYGRLYSWDAAMTACPQGWHIPSRLEFNDLIKVVESGRGQKIGGAMLKSRNGWGENNGKIFEDNQRSGNGLDAFGFSAFPAGYIHLFEEEYYNKGKSAYFWSSSENDWGEGYYLELSAKANAQINVTKEVYGYSVRCLRD